MFYIVLETLCFAFFKEVGYNLDKAGLVENNNLGLWLVWLDFGSLSFASKKSVWPQKWRKCSEMFRS